ncbi:MAG: phosphoglycolate phosphatase-like HAD superfamily hydrolase [Acidimicrobiales bacterium]|jgi:phosphoglycolate phosphatase-like HAD superfamily hydrolase
MHDTKKKNRVIIWDWDGTLVDSMTFKYGDIWKEVFVNESQKQKIAIGHLQSKEGKGKNRYGLIIHTLIQTSNPEFVSISEDVLKDNALIQKYAQIYDGAAKRHVYNDGLYPNVVQLLEMLTVQGYCMYMISGGGTDTDLDEMTTTLGVRPYFKKVYGFGSGETGLTRFGKMSNYERLLQNEGGSVSNGYIVIGDSQTDKDFAEKIGASFVGVESVWNQWGTSDQVFPTVACVAEVESVLKEFEE